MHPAGTLIKWSNYPLQEDGRVKDRYFLMLGKTGYGTNPVLFHVCTSTTQFHYYEKNKPRANHPIYILDKDSYNLPEKCLLDFDLGIDSVEESIMKNSSKDISVLSKIDNNEMSKIWDLLRCSDLSKRILIDIRHSLNVEGYTGLKNL